MVQDLHFGKGQQYEAFPSDTTTITHSMAKHNLNKTEKTSPKLPEHENF
jgi:hypothetical protein